MKRLLQALALVQLFLVVALGVRLVGVWSTPLPEFVEIPELPALAPLPPPRPPVQLASAVTEGIVEHDLFDEERGQGVDPTDGDIVVDEAPIPPPSTVKLVGVMMLGPEPMAILHDTNIKPDQQSVRKGEMFGEYEVGSITESGLILLGNGQQYQVPLRIEAGAPGAPVAVVGAPAQAAVGRPAPARPANPRADAAAQKVANARERAQAIAQRNAEMRKTGQRNSPGEQNDQQEPEQADPVQARLDALRALREAAKSR